MDSNEFVILDKCPYCGIRNLKLITSMGTPVYLFCKFCNKKLTEVIIKDYSKLKFKGEYLLNIIRQNEDLF